MPLSSGQILNNRYRIVKLLGQGGFGAVYRAWDMNMETPRAIKENLDTSPEAQRQFKREAQILGELLHPNLPRVFDHFTIPEQGQYLVMDYVEGQDLQERLDASRGPLPEAQALEWIGQVCDALAYLHSHTPPVIHRDIKPANIRITPDGKAKLVDFGIAKVYDPRLSTTLGARAVTPGYSPQEQYGQGSTDARSDVYALGATLYALVTGQQPVESIQRSLGQPLPPPRALNPALSARSEQAILKAMQLLPGNRCQSAAEFKDLLSGSTQPAVLQTSQVRVAPTLQVAAAPGSAPRRAPGGAPARRAASLNWAWAAVGLVAVVIVMIAGIALGIYLLRPPGVTATPEARVVTATRAPEEGRATQAATLEPSRTPAPNATPTSPPQPTALPPTAAPQGGETDANSRDGAALVYIPAGEFNMGLSDQQISQLLSGCPKCKSSSFEPSKPVHAVYLDAYWIYQTEVTNRMYALCVQAGACNPPVKSSSKTHSSYYGSASFNDYPVIYVDWYAADAYCRWAGGRLPSEAEWEKAGRGNDGRLFPWGSQLPTPQLANVAGFTGDTTAVGAYPAGASPYGLFDMAGNVYEWVADWYGADYYASSPYNNPSGPGGPSGGKQLRVVRGGNLSWEGAYAASGYHDYWEPEKTSYDVGFRCIGYP